MNLSVIKDEIVYNEHTLVQIFETKHNSFFNGDVKRIFSSLNAIKTKGRNRLNKKSVCAILKVKQGVKESGGCVKYSSSTNALSHMTPEFFMLKTLTQAANLNRTK